MSSEAIGAPVRQHQAILALENGDIFPGYGFGAYGSCVGEVVFNTSMTGYQEILTDPSYHQQMVLLTYPHIGNTGINDEDNESTTHGPSGLLIRHLPTTYSNWRATSSLSDWMAQRNILGISGIDTRHLTNVLRQQGAMAGCLMHQETLDIDAATQRAQSFPGLANADLAKIVTTPQTYTWNQGTWQRGSGYQTFPESHFKGHVVVMDFGVKHNILRLLIDQGYRVTVVPATTNAETILSHNPDGVLLSNGPGDPAPCTYAIDTIKQLLAQRLPLFGICLGHQLLALASGARTSKMKFGHHGANHPVQSTQGNVMITSQNHGFSVDATSLPDTLNLTHWSLFDHTAQGISHTASPAFGFQGHPEGSPGPHDIHALFATFDTLIQTHKS